MAKVPLCRCKCRKLPLQQVQLPLHCFALPQAATDCRYQLFLSMQLPRKPAAISYMAVPLPLPHMVLHLPLCIAANTAVTATSFPPS
jgi:hypothetical protein